LVLGVLVGALLSGFWPSTPMHAVATDKIDTFSMATGPVDADSEAVYFLDHLTGELYAYVLGRSGASVGPLCRFYRNIAEDFKANEKTKYLMATGIADLMRGGRAGTLMPSKAVLYVAELSTGTAVAYYLPYNAQAHRSGQPSAGQLQPVCAPFPIRRAVAAAGGKTKKDE
jgi:hypothetical protein